MMLLAELHITKGHLRIKGQIGYVPQQAWVFSGSVRQNIVFGQTFEEERYNKVIKACALEQVKYTKAATSLIGIPITSLDASPLSYRILVGAGPLRLLVGKLGIFLPICV